MELDANDVINELREYMRNMKIPPKISEEILWYVFQISHRAYAKGYRSGLDYLKTVHDYIKADEAIMSSIINGKENEHER